MLQARSSRSGSLTNKLTVAVGVPSQAWCCSLLQIRRRIALR